MTSIVLAFAGAIGAGKSAISTEVAAALGWPRTGFGDYIREEARRQGLDPSSREVLQTVGEALIAAGWVPFCQRVLYRAAWAPGQSLVIDGIRHVKAVETLRTLVVPAKLRLIYLEASDAVREPRLRQKGIVDDEGRRQNEAHSTEVEVPTLLPSLADYRVGTDMARDTVVRQLLSWLRQDTTT